MADSCRPVSRHGRYNAAGPSSVQYNTDMTSYSNADYTPSDEMYNENRPMRSERPRTSHGMRQSRSDIPPRPGSRRSGPRQQHPPADRDHESYGRPASRVGFSPETSYRYSHDEFSRKMSSDSETQLQNSPSDSTENLYTNNAPDAPYGQSPPQRSLHRQSPQHTDRLIVSPSNHTQQNIIRRSPRGYRQSPQQQEYRQSPQTYGHSPQGYRQSPQPQYMRPSSRDYMNVSPIQRDEPQLETNDIHHQSNNSLTYRVGDPYSLEGESYQQHFTDNPRVRNSPNGDNPQFRNSPYRDSPQHGDSHMIDSPYHNPSPTYGQPYSGSPDGRYRPPPAPRPKSARPKTGRKKSTRVRHRYEEQETSQPQQCDTSSILNTGDPYGRPSSSLSRYKPLPAIGVASPRTQEPTKMSPIPQSFNDPLQSKLDMLAADTQRLEVEEEHQFRPADDDIDAFSAEDIQGAYSSNLESFTNKGIPSVDVLTNFPQHLSQEIYKHSISNYDKNIADDVAEEEHEIKDRSEGSADNSQNSAGNQVSSGYKTLDFLHEIPTEPSDGEGRLLLAIKLPDGKRIQRYFSPADRLRSVLHFAENTSLVDYSDYQLACNAPKMIFTDLSVRIEDTNLQDRTVLYLEEKE